MLRVLRLYCSEYTGIPRRVFRRRVIRSNMHFKENFILWTTDWKGGSVEDRRLRSGGGERWCLDWVVEVDLVKDGKLSG